MRPAPDYRIRTHEQNACFHAWVRAIRDHLAKGGSFLDFEAVKELCLSGLGNTKVMPVPGMGDQVIAMRSHFYPATDNDLPPSFRREGYISFTELLGRVDAWAATDLGLNLQERQAHPLEWWEIKQHKKAGAAQ